MRESSLASCKLVRPKFSLLNQMCLAALNMVELLENVARNSPLIGVAFFKDLVKYLACRKIVVQLA